jgi:hypothetical protein
MASLHCLSPLILLAEVRILLKVVITLAGLANIVTVGLSVGRTVQCRFELVSLDVCKARLDPLKLTANVVTELILHRSLLFDSFLVQVSDRTSALGRAGDRLLVVAICRCFPVTPEADATASG